MGLMIFHSKAILVCGWFSISPLGETGEGFDEMSVGSIFFLICPFSGLDLTTIATIDRRIRLPLREASLWGSKWRGHDGGSFSWLIGGLGFQVNVSV